VRNEVNNIKAMHWAIEHPMTTFKDAYGWPLRFNPERTRERFQCLVGPKWADYDGLLSAERNYVIPLEQDGEN